MSGARFQRLAERNRRRIAFTLDGESAEALEGDTLLTAILLTRGHLRVAEFTEHPRAGFCLMGACQDCWVSDETGRSMRACTTLVQEGALIVTRR
jgi:predicted molibdopterin-dependent oxidoreductase YjgC